MCFFLRIIIDDMQYYEYIVHLSTIHHNTQNLQLFDYMYFFRNYPPNNFEFSNNQNQEKNIQHVFCETGLIEKLFAKEQSNSYITEPSYPGNLYSFDKVNPIITCHIAWPLTYKNRPCSFKLLSRAKNIRFQHSN